jgi:hypothetical protein
MLLVRVPTSSQLADILTKGLHYPQCQACDVPCVKGILSKKVRDPGPHGGMDRQGLQIESRRPLKGVCRHDLGS